MSARCSYCFLCHLNSQGQLNVYWLHVLALWVVQCAGMPHPTFRNRLVGQPLISRSCVGDPGDPTRANYPRGETNQCGCKLPLATSCTWHLCHGHNTTAQCSVIISCYSDSGPHKKAPKGPNCPTTAPRTHWHTRLQAPMTASAIPKLFQPIRVGAANLQHRVVMAPMTRCRADAQHVPSPLAVEYYKQRTSVPGSLVISEASLIAARAGGFPNIPGIWSDEQVAAWKSVVDAVHNNGSYIFLQISALGRSANPDLLKQAGNFPLVAPSPIPITPATTAVHNSDASAAAAAPPVPRPMTVEEIAEYVRLFAAAAENAVHRAGFDGVEIHGANGFLPDQFLQTNTNARTDAYGGSVRNRARFVLEVARAVVKAVGAERVGLRLSPWSTYQGMRMPDPVPTFSEVVTRIRDDHPDFAYIHILEPAKAQQQQGASEESGTVEESNKFLRDIWGGRPYIANSAFGRDSAIEAAEKEGGLISFGRDFISNPDLPLRLKDNLELAPSDPKTHYASGPEGYTDYPFAAETGIRDSKA